MKKESKSQPNISFAGVKMNWAENMTLSWLDMRSVNDMTNDSKTVVYCVLFPIQVLSTPFIKHIGEHLY